MTDPFAGDGPHGTDDDLNTRALLRALDDECEALEPGIATGLARARQAALRPGRGVPSGRERPGHGRGRLALFALDGARLALAGTMTAATLAAVLVAWPAADGPPTSPTAAAPVGLDAIPVVSGAEELEFYESIDFLLWLEGRRA